MLRELNINEMNAVSGGFANDELPTGGIELWDKDSDRSGSGIVPMGGDHGAIITNSLWSVQSFNLSQASLIPHVDIKSPQSDCSTDGAIGAGHGMVEFSCEIGNFGQVLVETAISTIINVGIDIVNSARTPGQSSPYNNPYTGQPY